VIESRTILREIAESLANLLPQSLPYINVDNLHLCKIKEVLDFLFYQERVELRSLKDVLNRKCDQLRLSSFLQRAFVSVMDIQMMVRRAWKVISGHTSVNGNALSFCK
jgi:hypothetical protein